MKFQFKTTIAVALVAGFVALTTGAAILSADSERKGDLHVTKECSAYNNLAGAYCTITSSNIAAIPAGSRVVYGQAAGIPPGVLDSDVVLDAGSGNRALGHCIIDGTTGAGLCTFSDGTGQFAGFKARVEVSTKNGVNFSWEGTYSFEKVK